jgi:HAMP domain-containing protein
MDEERRSARDLDLPEEERLTLTTDCDTKTKRNCRARQLYEAGWTLRAIGEAFTPSYRRSTVKYWVQQGDYVHRINVPIPTPNVRPTGYQRKKPLSPGIPLATQQRLAHLAPLARYFRSGMASTSIQAQANQELNELVYDLYSSNVTIAEIARAANVTFRAIARRLGR